MGVLFRVALVLLTALNVSGQSAQDIFSQAQTALNQGDLTTAEQDFRAVLKLEPNSLPARANLGVVYMRRHDWTRALDEFRIAGQLAPGNPGIALNKGLIYFHQENYRAAIPEFKNVLAANPSSEQARYLLGLCDFALEQYPSALADLTPLWESESSKLPYLYMLALSANKASDPQLEQQALEQMYRVGHDTAEYHLFLGRAWLARQRDDEAIRELQEALKLNPRLPFAHYTIGDIYAKAGKYQQAVAELTADAAIEPDLALDYEELGDVYAKLDRPADAERAYFAALKIDRHSARSDFGLAKIYKAQGSLTAALEKLDDAEKLSPESASLHYLRAQVLAALNRHPEAKSEFAESARLRQSTRDYLEQQVSGAKLDAAIALH
ncbi:MAG TPA: tetratricopeptide repeat protein [Bryobacteraceae bacterium]|jgi:tetratricopeptide (TPR) repeat protein|nr:tetratricopeptide repeat protein [Bryobacteraceae bacterium]